MLPAPTRADPGAGLVRPVQAAPLAATTPWRVAADAYLAAAIDSAETRRAYRRALERAFAWLGIATVADLNGAMLAAYRAEVTSSAGSPATQALALAALRSFLGWSRSMGAHALPAEVVRVALRTPRATVRRPYQVLSDPEIARVLRACALARDKALLGAMLGAGLRAGEVVGLDLSDVLEDQDGETALYIRQGKGRKDRTVPIQSDVARLLRAYLRDTGRSLGDAGPLFRAHDRAAATRPRGRLSTRAVGYLVQKYTAQIDGKRLSPHSMRHTYAIRAMRREGNVVKVSKLLGHASVSTTGRYLDHLGLGELRTMIPPLPGSD